MAGHHRRMVIYLIIMILYEETLAVMLELEQLIIFIVEKIKLWKTT